MNEATQEQLRSAAAAGNGWAQQEHIRRFGEPVIAPHPVTEDDAQAIKMWRPSVEKYDSDQPRDDHGRFAGGSGSEPTGDKSNIAAGSSEDKMHTRAGKFSSKQPGDQIGSTQIGSGHIAAGKEIQARLEAGQSVKDVKQSVSQELGTILQGRDKQAQSIQEAAAQRLGLSGAQELRYAASTGSLNPGSTRGPLSDDDKQQIRDAMTASRNVTSNSSSDAYNMSDRESQLRAAQDILGPNV